MMEAVIFLLETFSLRHACCDRRGLPCPSASLRCRWRSSCTESVLGTSAAFAPSQLGTRLLEQMLLRRRCASK